MIDPSQFLTPKKGMTSVEAANQFLEQERQQTAVNDRIFNMDELEKAALVRWTGFPFAMTVHNNRILLTDTTNGKHTTCMYSEPMDMKTGKRIFRALVRLKTMHDKANG
jgi:hypothetical protein